MADDSGKWWCNDDLVQLSAHVDQVNAKLAVFTGDPRCPTALNPPETPLPAPIPRTPPMLSTLLLTVVLATPPVSPVGETPAPSPRRTRPRPRSSAGSQIRRRPPRRLRPSPTVTPPPAAEKCPEGCRPFPGACGHKGCACARPPAGHRRKTSGVHTTSSGRQINGVFRYTKSRLRIPFKAAYQCVSITEAPRSFGVRVARFRRVIVDPERGDTYLSLTLEVSRSTRGSRT